MPTSRRRAASVTELLQIAVAHWGTDDVRSRAAMAAMADRADAARSGAETMLDQRLDDLFARGWAPADLVHVVARRLTVRHVGHAVDRLGADLARRDTDGQVVHPAWRDQVRRLQRAHAAADHADGLGAPVRSLSDLVDLLGAIARLPDLPVTTPPPGDPRSGLPPGTHLDERMLERVRALLAKAGSTRFEEEAEALTAKAQQLITRHAIDEALLHEVADVGQPSVRRLPIEDPYASARAYLVAEVARANRCRVVHSPDLGWVTVFGYDHDLAAVELLATSLVEQASAAMVRQGPRRDAAGRSRTRSFRRAFLLGFGQRIGERLRQTTEDQVATTGAADGRLLPVLAARADRLATAQQRAFPQVRRRGTSVGNGVGWSQGRVAADAADLDVTARGLPGG